MGEHTSVEESCLAQRNCFQNLNLENSSIPDLCGTPPGDHVLFRYSYLNINVDFLMGGTKKHLCQIINVIFITSKQLSALKCEMQAALRFNLNIPHITIVINGLLSPIFYKIRSQIVNLILNFPALPLRGWHTNTTELYDLKLSYWSAYPTFDILITA